MSAVLLDVIGRQSNWRFSCKSFVLLASLSTQSLNQFAESVSKAEALSEEIASIYRGFGWF